MWCAMLATFLFGLETFRFRRSHADEDEGVAVFYAEVASVIVSACLVGICCWSMAH